MVYFCSVSPFLGGKHIVPVDLVDMDTAEHRDQFIFVQQLPICFICCKLWVFCLDFIRAPNLKEHGLGLKEIQETIAKIDPLPGAREFLLELRKICHM